MQKQHDHRIILVTGATSGIGEAVARTFAREGWRVIISGRRRDQDAGRLRGTRNMQ
ncbi:MAG: SDR family NAD(P)-dependent oxidoreductase [Flavobacteriales bacterium]|nr:SDR family NAD(P)-dependent oxidoreductase [Flavobacteriales bacterium]